MTQQAVGGNRAYMKRSRENRRPISPEPEPDHGTCDPGAPPSDLGEPDDEFDEDLFTRMYAVCLA